ncbi:MAG: hypothetical protein LIO58_06405 [Oscillospiraceae bacterium]|nr:hypothetical protein [Oscillospiraceae bacterium]
MLDEKQYGYITNTSREKSKKQAHKLCFAPNTPINITLYFSRINVSAVN